MCILCFFFFNDTATTEIYTLSLHDALPISADVFVGRTLPAGGGAGGAVPLPTDPGQGLGRLHAGLCAPRLIFGATGDRKSTRLNSSHSQISYAVFCLTKKTKPTIQLRMISL